MYFGLLRSRKMRRDVESLGVWIPTFTGNTGMESGVSNDPPPKARHSTQFSVLPSWTGT